MEDIDVDTHIKNYWSTVIRGSSINENTVFDEFRRAVKEIKSRVFVNPDSRENTMRASRFFMFLDLEPVTPVINKYYAVKDGSEIYPRRAMVRAMFWRRIEGFNFTKEYMHLKDHPVDAMELGFELDENGNIEIPNWRTLRHFENERLGLEGQKELNNALVTALSREQGLNIGEYLSVDAMPTETTANDEDGEWNEHYKRKMVKSVIVSDVAIALPISAKVIDGKEDEGSYLTEMLNDSIAKLGNRAIKGIWIDGGFTSNENIAKLHVTYQIENVWYPVTVSWDIHKTFKHRVNGRTVMFEPEQEIEWQYPKLWKDSDYISNANLEWKMKILLKAGIVEPVAMYYRNRYCAMYEEAPDTTLTQYHKRNVEEGMHGILKEHYHLEDYLDRRGKKNLGRTVIGCVNAALAVALTRLQHGVKHKLVSTAYLT